MSTILPALRGTIRSRLLVNAVVDPAEAARHLPAGVRPHITDGATVVGCCLLDIATLRPAPLPSFAGPRVRAAACRIAVEWVDAAGGSTVGVYVPARFTNSRVAIAFGGRVFPGVHRAAAMQMNDDGQRLEWSVDPRDPTDTGALRVTASISRSAPSAVCEAVGGTCLRAVVGISPNRRGGLEAVRMDPSHRLAQPVYIEHLDASFLASFPSAQLAPSYAMRDATVVWTRVQAPQRAPIAVVR